MKVTSMLHVLLRTWQGQSIFFLFIVCYYTCCQTKPSPLHFSSSIDRFVDTKDTAFQFFQEFSLQFDANEESRIMLLSIESPSGVYNKVFLSKVQELIHEIQNTEGVYKVFSPLSANRLIQVKNKLQPIPLLHVDDSIQLQKDSILIGKSEEYRLMYWSKNGKGVLITVFPDHYLSESNYRKLLNKIENHSKKHFAKRCIMFSQTQLLAAYEKQFIENAFRLGFLTLLVTTGLLLFFFRNIRALFNPMVIIVSTLILLWVIVILQGGACDFLTIMIPVIIGMVTTSNVVFFRSYFQHSLDRGGFNHAQWSKEFKEVGLRVLLGNFFTAFGFYCLKFSGIKSLTDFGQFTTIGILTSYLLSYLLVRSEEIWNPAQEVQNAIIKEKVMGLSLWLKKYATYILFIAFGLLFCAVLTLPKIQVNGSLLSELPKNHPTKKASEYFDTAYGGARKLNLILTCRKPTDHWINASRLKQADSISQELLKLYSMRDVISPMFMIKAAHRNLIGDPQARFTLPTDDTTLQECIQMISLSPFAEEFARFLSKNGTMLRLSGPIGDHDLKTTQSFNQKFENFFKKSSLSNYCEAQFTGELHLLDQVPEKLVKEMKIGLAWIIGLLFVVLIIITRSISIALIGLISNIFPLIGIEALMSIAQIPFKADTAIIFPIAFGISSESTLHILQRFSMENQKNQMVLAAYTNAYLKLFRPITKNACIFLLSFSILLFSNISGIRDIGLLIVMSLLLSWISNLIIMNGFIQFLLTKNFR